MQSRPAQMAELVDAQVSGTCGRKAVEVRVLFWAPLLSARIEPPHQPSMRAYVSSLSARIEPPHQPSRTMHAPGIIDSVNGLPPPPTASQWVPPSPAQTRERGEIGPSPTKWEREGPTPERSEGVGGGGLPASNHEHPSPQG